MRNKLIVAIMLWWLVAVPAMAQQATNIPAATQPGVGSVLFRSVTRYTEYDDDPTELSRDIQRVTVENWVAYGATPRLSFMFNVPYESRDTEDDRTGKADHQQGVGDVHIMAKYRIYQNDTGPIDTARLSLTLGADLPTGYGPFTGGDSVDPMIGIVYTQIKGRHGFNGSLRYMFGLDGDENSITPGDNGADLLQYEAGYLYRLHPAEFRIDSAGGWYAMFETNGLYETNGDNELLLSPGIMFEAPGWVIEASIQLPAWQELDHRPERRYTLALGFRILF